MTQGIDIFNVVGMADAIRYTEYKDIHSAISEIVDNSVEANARNILIISNEDVGKNGEKVLKDIAILDNGDGMDDDTLQKCLVFGSSSRAERKSIGRFGVGLGQASMYAASRVEVYSWQNNSDKKFVYLDSKLMKDGIQKQIERPKIKDFPIFFKGFLNINIPDIGSFNFHEKGTMVIWNSIDKDYGRPQTFYKKLSEELGRKFRYYIEKNVNIVIITTQHSPREKIKIVDPLFLLENSRYLADRKLLMSLTDDNEKGEPIFEPFITELTPHGYKDLNVRLETPNGKPFVSIVRLKCSVVKEKYYWDCAKIIGLNNPGNSEIGKKAGQFDSISIVRAGREIQADKFNIYNSMNKNENRWWSLELSFSPELDEFFKLSNNKQKIEIMNGYLSKNKDSNADDNSLKAQAWQTILDNINTLIRNMQNRNSKLASKARTSITNDNSINMEFSEGNASKNESNNVKKKSIVETPLEIKRIYENKLIDKFEEYINVEYTAIKNEALFSIELKNRDFKLVLNEQNDFYKKANSNRNFMTGFNLFASVLATVREQFILFDEENMFDKLVEQINLEFEIINENIEE